MFIPVCDICGMQEKPAETAKGKKVRSASFYPNQTGYAVWQRELCGECFDMIVKQLEALCTERWAD